MRKRGRAYELRKIYQQLVDSGYTPTRALEVLAAKFNLSASEVGKAVGEPRRRNRKARSGAADADTRSAKK